MIATQATPLPPPRFSIVVAVLILIILLTACASFGQTLTLPERVTGTPDDFIRIQATTDCSAVQWVPLDAGLSVFPVELLRDSRTLVVIARKSGSYRVLAHAAKGDVATKPAICLVVVGDVSPTPPVPPVPPPNPEPPVSKVDKVWIVVVEESSERSAEMARLLGDLDYWRGLEAKGHRWRIYDKDNPAVAEKGLMKHISNIPGLIIMSMDGTVLRSVKMPSSRDALNSIISEVVK